MSEGERESLFQEERPKAENDREPTVERLYFVLGMRKLKVSEAITTPLAGSQAHRLPFSGPACQARLKEALL